MTFDPNDIQRTLLPGNEKVQGVFDMISWQVNTGSDLSADESRLVSLHEYYHWVFTNSTGYGCVMMMLAIMYEESKDTAYLQQLGSMVSQCQETHEIFATWMSTCAVKDYRADRHGEALLKIEYIGYYQTAENWVRGIPSRALCLSAVNACLTYCMQGRAIAISAMNDLAGFSAEGFAYTEYPDNRLRLLKDLYTPGDIENILAEFVATQESTSYYESLRLQLTGELDLAGIEPEEVGWVTALTQYFGNVFDKKLSEWTVSSLQVDEHLQVVGQLYAQLYSLFPGAERRWVINTHHYDFFRNMMINFEVERLHFRNKSAGAVLRFPSSLSATEKDTLLARFDGQVFLTGAIGPMLLEQFRFHNEDAAWLRSLQQPVTFLQWQEGDTIYILPFTSPEEWIEFIGEVPENRKVTGIIHYSATSDEWCQIWLDTFIDSCSAYYYLNDVSILIFIEEKTEGLTRIWYNSFVIEIGGREFNALVFQYRLYDVVTLNVICPCSIAHGEIVRQYLEASFPAVANEHITGTAKDDVFGILEYVYTYYLQWEFRQGSVMDHLLKK